jgi:hypothetical protein
LLGLDLLGVERAHVSDPATAIACLTAVSEADLFVSAPAVEQHEAARRIRPGFGAWRAFESPGGRSP